MRGLSQRLSPELELLIQFSRLKLKARHRERIQELLEGPLNWDRVYQAADFHRLTPLVNQHLLEFADSVSNANKETFRAASLAILATNMRMVGELHELSRQFSEAEIPCLFLKGPITAFDTYGNLGLRPFLDLDVLILRRDIERTYDLLTGLGFTPQFSMSESQRRNYYGSYSELCLWKAKPETIVDVHWDLIELGYSYYMDSDAIWESRKPIQTDGHEYITLGDDDWLFFACIHASKHSWSRIGWLVDIAEHIKQNPGFDWNQLVNRLEAKRAGRRLLTTCALLSRFLGVAATDEIDERIKSDNKTNQLVNRVVADWEQHFRQTAVLPHRNPHYLAYESMTDRATYLYRNFFRPTPLEWELWPLPRLLYPLYFVFRPLRLVYRRIVRAK